MRNYFYGHCQLHTPGQTLWLPNLTQIQYTFEVQTVVRLQAPSHISWPHDGQWKANVTAFFTVELTKPREAEAAMANQ